MTYKPNQLIYPDGEWNLAKEIRTAFRKSLVNPHTNSWPHGETCGMEIGIACSCDCTYCIIGRFVMKNWSKLE